MKLIVFPLLIISFSAALLEANGPVMTGGAYEVTVDNVDSGGSAGGYTGGITSLLQVIGEPGGITTLSGGGYTLNAGYLGQDLIAPVNITNLGLSLNVQNGALTLSWSAPGDDQNTGELLPNSGFFISSTTVLTNAQSLGYWNGRKNNNLCDIVITTGSLSNPVNPGNSCSWPINGLVQGATYYFRIWTLDQACNWSDISTGATIYYLLAPGPITDLAATQGAYGRSIALSWTAPTYYNNQLPAGGEYAIQRSSWSGAAFSTSSVDDIYVPTGPVTTGVYQAYNLTSLQQGVTYYMAVWTADEYPNWSGVSNTTSTWATMVILSVTLAAPTYYNFGLYSTGVSTDTPNGFVLNNTGNVIESYSLSCSSTTNWGIWSSPGQNIFELQGAFNAARPSPLSVYNSYSNVLSTTPAVCSGSAFTAGSQTGAGVDPFNGPGRNLWFLLSTPLATSTTAQQNMTFTTTATQTFP